MLRWKVNRLVLILGVSLLCLLSSACSVVYQPEQPSTTPEGTHPVDINFREFYNLLGGEPTLGYPISPLFEFNGVRYQYTEKALLQYDPLAPVTQQFSLAELGLELGMQDEPMVLPEQGSVRMVDGYIIYDEFVASYDALEGARFAGRPLTQVRVNYTRGRIEQYFTNVGFYRSLTDPPGTVHLLAYGAWKCDLACRRPHDPVALVAPNAVFPEPFVGSLARLGSGFAGRPLSEPYQAADGKMEQIYEYFVVFADPANVRIIGLRPIASLLGISPWAPVPKIEDPRMVFYPLQGELGHNVPAIFDEYITLHGGLEISGLPITEIFQESTFWRQCFENYCLDYDPAVAAAAQIRLAPLGRGYLEMFPPLQAAYANLNFTSETTRLTIWEAHSLITSAQTQRLYVQVMEANSQLAIPNVEATVNVTLPDGLVVSYPLGPTDPNGQAWVEIPAVQGANGTLIPYQVCLSTMTGSPLCATDSYVLWGNP